METLQYRYTKQPFRYSNITEYMSQIHTESTGAHFSSLLSPSLRHHTLVLVESSKTIYSFGCGEQRVPIPVHLPPGNYHPVPLSVEIPVKAKMRYHL